MHACLISQTPKPLPRHQAAPAYSFPKGKVANQQKQKNNKKKAKTLLQAKGHQPPLLITFITR